MSEFIIILLFVVAAVVAWAWLRRRHVVGESQADKPAAEKEPSIEDSQAGSVTDAKTPASTRAEENSVLATNAHSLTSTGDSASASPHESPQPKPHSAEPESVHTQTASCLLSEEQPQPCPISALVHMPVTPPLISPEVTFPATNETTSHEQNSAIREPEQIQPTSAPPPDANLSREDVSVLSEAPEREPLVAETKTPSPVLEARRLWGRFTHTASRC